MIFKSLEKHISKHNEELGMMSVDLDIYPNEKRAVAYLLDGGHIVEMHKLDDGYYCILMTELEEKVLNRKKVKNDSQLIDLIDYYQDLSVCGKISRIA